MKNYKILSSILTLIFAAPHLNAENFTAKPSEGSVEFVAIGNPSFLKIEGKGEGPSGKIQIDGAELSGVMEFKLDSLTTGIDTRDEHMKEKYLKTKDNPISSLTLSKVKLDEDFKTSNGLLKIKKARGVLKVNGVEQNVGADLKVSGNNGKQEVVATFKINLSDFEIEIPSFAGITVADEVEVKVKTGLSPDSTTTAPAR